MVSVIYYYKLLNDNQVKKLVKALAELKKEKDLDIIVFNACSRIIERAVTNSYIILDGFYTEESNELVDRTFTINNASVWKSKPQTYKGCKRDLFKDDCWPYLVKSDYREFLNIIKSTLILDFKQNGQNQNQLQKQGNSNSEHYEGSILHGGRNRPQLTAGRHCNQAGIEIQGTRVGGSKIYLSSRCPEVLVSSQRDRVHKERSPRCEGTPGGAGIQRDCSYLIDDYGNEIIIKLRTSKFDCNEIGDSYLGSDDTLFILTGWDYVCGCRTAKFSVVK